MRREWVAKWDPFLDLSFNPFRTVADVVDHLGNVGVVYVGGPKALGVVVALVAVGGLLWEAWRGPSTLSARFLLIALGLAMLGGAAERSPFGPTRMGGRASLWLVPVIAIGLAFALGPLWERAAGILPRRAVDATIVAAALALLAVNVETAPRYPSPGSRSATEWIEARVDADDLVLISHPSMYPYVLASDQAFTMEPEHFSTIGYVPRALDPRFMMEVTTPMAEIGQAVSQADRVFSHRAAPTGRREVRMDVDVTLHLSGFEVREEVGFGIARVLVWERVDAPTSDAPPSDQPVG